MKKINLEQQTDLWKTWRAAGLGGSDIHTVVSGTQLERKDLIHRTITGEKKHFQQHVKDAMARGVALEPEARALAERALAIELPPICIESDFDKRFRASLDGLSKNGAIILEVKCLALDTHMRVYKKYLETGSAQEALPASYFSQIQYQLLVAEADVAYYAGYNPDAPIQFYLIPVNPDYAYHSVLRETALGYFDALDRAKGIPNIIGISGYAKSGKDTVAEWLRNKYNYKRFAHADNLKADMVKKFGMPEVLSPQEKEMWRDKMVEYSRVVKLRYGQDIWSQHLMGDIRSGFFTTKDDHIVVPDVRYINEMYNLKKFATEFDMTFQQWHVVRGEAPNAEEAMSVPLLEERADFVFTNVGTLEELYQTLEEEMIRYGNEKRLQSSVSDTGSDSLAAAGVNVLR